MTTVFGLVDPDPERRAMALCSVEHKLTTSDKLHRSLNRWERNSLVMMIYGTSSAPLSQASSRGSWAGVCGNILMDDDKKTPAELVLSISFAKDPLAANGRGGFYLSCMQNISGEVVLCTDALGLFPLFYWATPELFVFSSSPGLILMHPSHTGKISPEGLAGIMLFGYMANDQSIWEGIRRPEAGHALRWRKGGGADTPISNPLKPSENYFHLNYASARKLTADALHHAVQRSIRAHNGPINLLLSGGLDSRLVAGYLAKEAPGRIHALTIGNSGDVEAQCARRVVRALNISGQRICEHFESYDSAAIECINRESLSHSLWDFAWFSAIDGIPTAPLLSGMHGDVIMGGSFIPKAWDARRGIYCFNSIFKQFNAWGFSAEEVPRLVCLADMQLPVRHVLEKLKAQYEALPGLPYQRATLWTFMYRLRFHVMPTLFRISARGWPLMPYADPELLNVTLGMPLDYIRNRRFQVDTLRCEFPGLAKLPLDRNSYDQKPILPTAAWHASAYLASIRRYFRLFRKERRTYYRQFDINNEGWVRIRMLAESSRPFAHRIFKPERFDYFIPPPNNRINCSDGIVDTAKHKLLICMMLFLGSIHEV